MGAETTGSSGIDSQPSSAPPATSLTAWINLIAEGQTDEPERCKANLDALQLAITVDASAPALGLADLSSSDNLLSALIKLVRKFLLDPSASSPARIRATTSALRCVIALTVHGCPELFTRNPRRVHEVSMICLSVLPWVSPPSSSNAPALKTQSSTSSLSHLRRPSAQASAQLQQTGALGFALPSASSSRQSRSREALPNGNSSRSSSTSSSWRAPPVGSSSVVTGTSVPPSPTKATQRAATQEGRTSRGGSAANRSSASELDSEDSSVETRRETRTPGSGDSSRASKYYCLTCLSQLNAKAPRLLFQEWPALFSHSHLGLRPQSVVNVSTMTRPNQALSVRTAAIQLCEAALEQAGKEGLLIAIDDRPQRSAAFTSLASRTGAIVSEIRSCIVSVLAAPHNTESSSTLVLAALKAARALLSSTPNTGYLHRSAAVLTPPVVALCSSTDSATAAAAFSVLSELMNASKQPEAQPDVLPLDSILAQLSHSDRHGTVVRTQAWKALRALLERDIASVRSRTQEITELCSRAMKESPLELERQAAMSALGAILHARIVDDLDTLRGETTILRASEEAISFGIQDRNALVRCAAADCHFPLAAASAGPSSIAMQNWAALVNDSEAAVVAASVRALGVAFDSGFASAALRLEGKTAFTALIAGFEMLSKRVPQGTAIRDAPLDSHISIIKMRASWAFATMCDKTASSLTAADEDVSLQIVPLCITTQALCGAEDRIAANGLRALGALLHLFFLGDDVRADVAQAIEQALQTILRTLRQGHDPKVRWNAGAALERAFGNSSFRGYLLERDDSRQGPSLTQLASDLTDSACSDKIFKVRLASLQALMQLCSNSTLSAPARMRLLQTLGKHRSRFVEAQQDLSTKAEEASFKERQLHVDPCRKAVDSLLVAMDALAIDSNE
ncbi:hypothetical protein V8E36_002856 [Tilletia maclaganii]